MSWLPSPAIGGARRLGPLSWEDRSRVEFLVLVTAFGLAVVLIEIMETWLGCGLTDRFRCALQVAATRDQEMP